MRYPTQKARPYKDPFLLYGAKQREHLAFTRENESGNVSAIGIHSLNRHEPNKENSLAYCVTQSLLRHIFKRHYKVDFTDPNESLTNLFPAMIRHHWTTTSSGIHYLPTEGFVGIEWIVAMNQKGSQQAPAGGPTEGPNRLFQVRSAGFTLKSTTFAPTKGIAGGITTASPRTVNDFIKDAANLLVAFTGSKYIQSVTATSVTARRYDSNTFTALLNTYNRNFTEPSVDLDMGQTSNANILDGRNYEPDEVELYGYRLIEIDTDNLSQSGSTHTEWTYKLSPIHRVDNLKVIAQEKKILEIRNVTPSDAGIYDTNQIDPNPLKGRAFLFKGTPKLYQKLNFNEIYMDEDEERGKLSTATYAGQTVDLLKDVVVRDNNTIVWDSTVGPNTNLFSVPDNNGIILRGYLGTKEHKIMELPPPTMFTNCTFDDFYIKSNEVIRYPLSYSFSGYIKDFYKNIHVNGTFTPYSYITSASVRFDSNWEDLPGQQLVCCLGRARRHATTETSPKLDVDIYVKRKAIIVKTHKKEFAMEKNYGTSIIETLAPQMEGD